jgi:uncharacterized protein (TIGR03083 family)
MTEQTVRRKPTPDSARPSELLQGRPQIVRDRLRRGVGASSGCVQGACRLASRSVATLTHLDFVDALRRETGQLSMLLATADPAAPVGSCPGWAVRDLVEHLGGVHRWSTQIVRTGERTPFPDEPVAGDLGRWFDDGAETLARTLAETDATRACWTMAPPRQVAFWSRRQAHEAMIHRWDLASAVGAPIDLDPDLAIDGIDEAVTMFFPRQIALARQAPLTDAVAIVEVGSGRRWVLEGDGTTTDHDAADVGATVSGDATPLLLLLWQRLDLEDSAVEVDGDRGAAGRVLGARLTP